MLGKQVSHYRIVELIGEGGMGAVYKAEDLNLEGHVVAIKVIKPSHRDRETANRLFLRGAQAIARIDHANVVTLLEVIQEDGIAYIVMPFVEGKSLSDILQNRRLEPAEALSIASQVAAGLEAAHALGVVHRDIKPENVMVTASGSCKILDFGLARLVERSTLGDSGRIVGTARYMAPEQVRGETVDARTDIYGLGALLFEMLTGRRPFEAREEVALFYEITNRPAPSILTLRSDLPPDLDRIVGQALNKRPGDRYSSVSEMRNDLEIVRTQLSTQTNRGRRIRAYDRLTPARVRAVVLSLAGLLVVAALVMWLKPIPGPPRIMVMKWENLTAQKDLDWLTSGIMDCLIRALGGREGLNVISRQTVTATLEAISPQAAGFAHAGAVGAAAQVGATYLVAGDIELHESRVRVNCELTDLRKGILVRSWSRDFTDLDSEFYPTIEAFASDIAAEVGSLGRAQRRKRKSVAQTLTASIEALTYYQKALEAAELGNIPTAMNNLSRAIQIDSSFVDAHRLAASLARDVGDQEQHLAQAMKYRFKASASTRELVEADNLVFHHQIDAGIQKYVGILTRDPEEVQARVALADLYMRRRRFADACAEYGVVHRMSPYDFSFYTQWSWAYLEIGRDDKARGILEDWHRQFPREQAPLRSLIHHLESRGQYESALALCDTMDRLAPAAATTFRGYVFYDLGKLHAADSLYRELQRAPDPFSPASGASSFLAFLCYRERRYAEGLKLIEAALKDQPEAYNYWLAGMLSAGSGDSARARRYARSIAAEFAAGGGDSATAEAYGDRRYYYHIEGLIELAGGRPAAAARMFEEALRYTSRPDSPYFRTDLGLALLDAGNVDRAVEELRRVLDFNPRYPDAMLYLGRAYVLKGRYAEARTILRDLKTLWKEADADDPLNAELSHLLSVTASKG